MVRRSFLLRMEQMPIRVFCDCGQKLVAGDHMARKKIRCPTCNQIIRLPIPDDAITDPGFSRTDAGLNLGGALPVEILERFSVPDTEGDWRELQAATPPVEVAPAYSVRDMSPSPAEILRADIKSPEFRRFATRFVMAMAILVWIVTMHSKPYTTEVCTHYFSLAIFSAMLPFEIFRHFKRWRSLQVPFAIAFVVLAWSIWPRFDSYDTQWYSDTGTRFVDSYSRSGKHWYRHLTMKSSKGTYSLGYSSEGPMSGTPPRPHGHWLSTSWEPVLFEQSHHWFWYGEEITQGEWELRQK